MNEAAVSLGDGSAADLDAVMRIMTDSFDPRFGEAWTGPQCASLLSLPGVWLTLARLGEDVAGFALARAIAGEAELLLLAVRRDVQGRGVGRQLLAGFVEAARSRGARRLHLEVREGNHAVKLYEQAGFSLAGRRRNYYAGDDGKTYDALTLARSETPPG